MNIIQEIEGGPNAPPLSTGWAVAIASIAGVLLASTPAAKYVLGVLGVALIYQVGLMLQNK